MKRFGSNVCVILFSLDDVSTNILIMANRIKQIRTILSVESEELPNATVQQS